MASGCHSTYPNSLECLWFLPPLYIPLSFLPPLVHLQFESDLQKLKIERLRSFKAIEDYLEAFERKRTHDLRVGKITHRKTP